MNIKLINRFIATAGILIFIPAVSYAKILKLEVASEFNTETPEKTILFKTTSNTNILDTNLPKYTIINCNITAVKPPKRLKRNATFYYEAISYETTDNEIIEFAPNKGKYIKTINAKATAKSIAKGATKTVANKFVPGLGIGISAIDGALKTENGNKLKGAAKGIYESTPLSYFNKGTEIYLSEGDYIISKLSTKKRLFNNK